MAEEWLEEIYQDARVITRIKEAVRLLHAGDDIRGCDIWNGLIPEIRRICEKYDQISPGAGAGLMRFAGQVAQKGEDYIAFADAMEEDLLPLLEVYMRARGHIHVEEGTLEIESSVAGYLSLRDVKNDYQIHGLADPMEDARVMAESVYRPELEEYCILGGGFGYLAYQIYLVSQGSAKIRIYETDSQIRLFAEHYGVLDWIPQENLYVERDTDILKFLCYVDQHPTRCVISEWAQPFIPERERPAVEKVYVSYSILRDVVDTNFAVNFWRNLESGSKMISELPKPDSNGDYMVVAAGPSLDLSMDFLIQNRERMKVIAVGTVFRKLLNRGIIPDYVAILESHELVYEQLRGIEEQKVPIVMPMCAYWKIAECYQGDIYLFPSCECQESVEYARKNQMDDIWEVGGTVSFTAMELAVKLGAVKVYLLGLDLAYPDAISHAEDTPQRKKMNQQNLTMVEKVGGGQVYSDYGFTIYREAIEKYIAGNKKVKFYNLSKLGARIKGTVEPDGEDSL